MAKTTVPAKLFSVQWKAVEEDLGFKPKGTDPIVQAIGRFQDAVFMAAQAVKEKRKPNPHADAPLPDSVEELLAECGEYWTKTIRKEISEVFKLSRYFRGGRFPLFVYGREESPYTVLLERLIRQPNLVQIGMEGFQTVEHFGLPFPKKEQASA